MLSKVLFGAVIGGTERGKFSSRNRIGRLRHTVPVAPGAMCAGKPAFRLQQTQLAGTGGRFGAPLDPEFAKDFPIVSFHCVQGEEKPLANLMI